MSYTLDYVAKLFPEALKIKQQGGTEYPRLAISVFDHWLNEEESSIIENCPESEKTRRNQNLTAHWQKLFLLTPIFQINENGLLKQASDEETFVQESMPLPDKTAEQFQFIIMPEYKAIYAENWDDTNLLWYQNRGLIKPILKSAKESGLYVLNSNT